MSKEPDTKSTVNKPKTKKANYQYDKDKQRNLFLLTLNNALKYGYSHEKIHEIMQTKFKHLQFYCFADEISTTGTPHTHLFILLSAKKRWSAVQRAFPHAHIEKEVKGSPSQVVAYIKKTAENLSKEKIETRIEGTYEEWGSLPVVLPSATKNEILLEIEQLIEKDLTPREIMSQSILYAQYDNIIRKRFYEKRFQETPSIREIKVYWHVGESGSGKSYTYVKLCELHGSEEVFFSSDYSCNGTALFSNYEAEQIVFLDEFKGGLPYSMVLQLLQGYRAQIHCRYSNVYALYKEIHITSIFSPDEIYDRTVEQNQQNRDTITQLLRRIDFIIYHYKDAKGNYCTYEMPMSEYKNYEDLQRKVKPESDGFCPVKISETPFDSEPEPQQLTLQTDTDNKMPFED